MLKFIVAAILALVAARPAAACVGDCGNDRSVTVDDLLTGVSIALGSIDVSACDNLDANTDHQVTVDEILSAVANALTGCVSYEGSYSGQLTFDPGHIGVLGLSAEPGGQACGKAGCVTGSLIVADGGASASAFSPSLSFSAGGFSVSVSGNADLNSGSFHVSGSFVDGNGQNQTIDISGTLPGPTGAATLTAQVGSETFSGTLAAGMVPTPTPSTNPSPRPTAAPGCGGGYAEATFSNAQGTNSYEPLSGTLALTNVSGALNTTFGGNAIICPIASVSTTVRRFQWAILDLFGGPPTAGKSYQITTGGPIYLITSFDYLETLPTNPFGTQGWRARSGTFTIDSVVGDTVTFHVTDAMMTPEPSFSYNHPAMGTFTMNFTGTIDMVKH